MEKKKKKTCGWIIGIKAQKDGYTLHEEKSKLFWN